MTSPAVSGFIHALGALFIALLVARGGFTAAEGSMIEPLIEGALAAGVTLAVAGFAWWQKHKVASVMQSATQQAFSDGSQPNVTPVSPHSQVAVAAAAAAISAVK